MLTAQYHAPVHSPRPSAAEAAPHSDPRYRIPGEADSAEILQPAAPGFVPAVVLVVWATGEVDCAAGFFAPFVPCQALDAADRSHPVAEYIGYTCFHLPVKKESAPLPSAADAAFASFAARMAFSSF